VVTDVDVLVTVVWDVEVVTDVDVLVTVVWSVEVEVMT